MATHNTGSGNWHDTKTWKPDVIPNRDTNVVMDVPGTVTLTGNAAADRLAIEGGVTLQMTDGNLSTDFVAINLNSGNLRAQGGTNHVNNTLISRGSLFVEGGATLNVDKYASYGGNVAVANGATLQTNVSARNYGTIALSSTGDLTTLKLSGSLSTELDVNHKNYQYTGGQVTLSDSAQNLIQGSFRNVNNVISGAGTIRSSDIVNLGARGTGFDSGDHSAGIIRATGANNALILDLEASSALALDNGGVIEGRGAAPGKAGLLIRTAHDTAGTARVRNTGLIAAVSDSNGVGKVVLENVDVNNTGGTIQAANLTAELRLHDTKITGGTLSSVAGSGVFATGSVTGVNVNIGGDLGVSEGNLKVHGGTFGIGRNLTVGDGASLAVSGASAVGIGGKLTVAGKFSFDSALTLQSGATDIIDGVLSGPGATLNNIKNTVTGDGTVKVATLVNHVAGHIDGSLKLDIGTKLTNAGSIVGASIEAETVTNSGTMSGVAFRTTTSIGVAGVINQKSGVINAASFGETAVANQGLIQAVGPGHLLTFAGTEIIGGTLASSQGGVISVQGSSDRQTFIDVDKIGQGTAFVAGNGALLALNNSNGPSISLDQVSISLKGANRSTQLAFLGDFTLMGAGTIILSDSANNKVTVGGTLTNIDGTISGAGTVKSNSLLDNQAGGTIEANGKNSLTIEAVGGGGARLRNDGRLEADGATLRVVTDTAILGGGEVLATNGGTVDLSDARQFLGDLNYLGRGTILGPDVVPAGTIGGFSVGDTYVFGKNTSIGGELSTVWQENASDTGGTLTIKAGNQTYASLQLAGIYTSSDFAATRVAMADGQHISVSFVGPLKWLNPVNGDWHDATSWGPTGLFVPGPADAALLSAASDLYAVTSAQDTSVKSVGIGGNARLFIRDSDFIVTSGTGGSSNAGTVRVDYEGTLVVGGTFEQTLEGKIKANGQDATIDIAKGGTISRGHISLRSGTALNAAGGSASLVDVVVFNHGAINVANKTTLTIDGGVVNGEGSIKVEQGSTLAASTKIGSNLELAGTLKSGDTTTYGGTHLLGGRIVSGGLESAFVNQGHLDGTGTIGDANLTFVNALSGGSIATGLDEGGGKISAGKITIAAGETVSAGKITARAGGSIHVANKFLNNSDFLAETGGTAQFDGAVTNQELMKATGAGSALTLKGGMDNSGVVEAADGGQVTMAGAITQSGAGKLATSGTLSKLTLGSGASVTGGLIEIGAYGQLAVVGQATVGQVTLSFGSRGDLKLLNATLQLTDSDLDSAGTAEIANGTLRLIDTDVTGGSFRATGQRGLLESGGTVTLTDTAVDLERGARIVSNGAAATLTNAGLITAAGGFVGDAHLTLINDGIIATGAFDGAPMIIDTGANAIVNNGLITGSVANTKVTIKSTLNNGVGGELQSGLGTVSTFAVNNAGLVEATTGGHIAIHGGLANVKSGLVQASDGGTLEALVTQNAGRAVAVGDGSLLALADASSVADNSGHIVARDGGTVRFGNGVSNATGGQLIAKDGGQVQVFGAATGGIARILGDGSVVDFEGSDVTTTTTNALFDKEGFGRLLLNNSSRFAGTVSGFAEGDTIDIEDVAFVAGKSSYDEGTDTLTISDGKKASTIQLLGHYTAADFAFSSDGHGGTLITGTSTADPAAAPSTMFLAAAA